MVKQLNKYVREEWAQDIHSQGLGRVNSALYEHCLKRRLKTLKRPKLLDGPVGSMKTETIIAGDIYISIRNACLNERGFRLDMTTDEELSEFVEIWLSESVKNITLFLLRSLIHQWVLEGYLEYSHHFFGDSLRCFLKVKGLEEAAISASEDLSFYHGLVAVQDSLNDREISEDIQEEEEETV